MYHLALFGAERGIAALALAVGAALSLPPVSLAFAVGVRLGTWGFAAGILATPVLVVAALAVAALGIVAFATAFAVGLVETALGTAGLAGADLDTALEATLDVTGLALALGAPGLEVAALPVTALAVAVLAA